MTAGCESWMSKLRKYVPKRFHFKRYYNVGMWLAIVVDSTSVSKEAVDAWLSPPQTVSAAQPAGAARPAASAADGATQPVGVDADHIDADGAPRGGGERAQGR